jgi:hypothetical protein
VTHVDGNALAGLLAEVFGREMTAVVGCCGDCGARNAVGALLVYRAGPGDVVRCPTCASVLLVISAPQAGARLCFASLRWLELPATT